MTPIWKDTYYSQTIGSGFYEYHIYNQGNLLYSGKAYKLPNESGARFSVNEIAQDHLSNHIKLSTGEWNMEGFCKDFEVVTPSNSRTYTFYNDWSYQPERNLLNCPINGKVDSRQFLFVNGIGSGSAVIKINGSNYDTLSFSSTGRAKVFKITTSKGSKMTIGNLKYTFSCGDYVLYYINAYGGWDSLLIDGKATRRDNLEPVSYTSKDGKVKYLNIVRPSWELTCSGGEGMHHLYESNEVYLHNLNTDEITKVDVTDSVSEFKTYHNQGNRIPSYTINVESCKEQYRR